MDTKDFYEEQSSEDFFSNTRKSLDGMKQMLEDIDRIRPIRDVLMECDTPAEVNNIFKANRDFFHRNPDAYKMIERAHIRIRRIRNEKLDSYKFQLN